MSCSFSKQDLCQKESRFVCRGHALATTSILQSMGNSSIQETLYSIGNRSFIRRPITLSDIAPFVTICNRSRSAAARGDVADSGAGQEKGAQPQEFEGAGRAGFSDLPRPGGR
jgi:hypothetical protein